MPTHPDHVGKRFSPRAVWVAVLASLAFHVLLWLGFCRLRPANPFPLEPDTPVVSTVFLHLPPSPLPPGIEESQGFEVKIAPSSVPSETGTPAAPVVRAHGSGTKQAPAQGATGSRAPAFFQVPVATRRVVFVVDRSLSMGRGGALSRARRELLTCLRALDPDAVFQVVLYNLAADPLPGGMMAPTEASLRCVEEVLAHTHPRGATDHVRALTSALTLRPDVVFLVTDADDLTTEQVRHITGVNRAHVVIHTIDVSRRTGTGMLAEVARLNGGRHVCLTEPQ